MVFRMTNDPALAERVLRAKYLDWCSAKVADRFLALTPDEIYELAHWRPQDGSGTAAHLASVQLVEPPSAAVGSPLNSAAQPHPATTAATAGAGYLALVRRAAEVLTLRLRLPPFEEWAEEYRNTPALFDEELLGLWQGWQKDGAGQE